METPRWRATLALSLVLATPALSSSAQAGRPKAPAIPLAVSEADRTALLQCETDLSHDQFARATARLTSLLPPTVVPVYVDWVPVPETSRADARQAAAAAIKVWNEALGGAVRFQMAGAEAGALLRILFEQGVARVGNGQATLTCAGLQFDPGVGKGTASQRTAVGRVALDVPYADRPHSAASLGHLFGQVLGLYLGLTPSDDPADLMGPDTHTAAVSRSVSARDLARLRELQGARLALAGYAKGRVAVSVPRAVLALDRDRIDAGGIERGDKAHYVFVLRNTGDAPLEVDARPTCGCTVASFDKQIPPGGQGKIEADINTAGFRGRIEKTIRLSTNDLDQPLTNLRLAASVRSAISVLPADMVTMPLSGSAATVKELEIRTDGKEPIQVTRASCTAPYASAKLDALPVSDSRGLAYKLTVTVQPTAPGGRSAFMVNAYTSSAREPEVSITVICEKGIVAMPPSVFLGSITPATALPVTALCTLSKAGAAFRIRKIASDDPELVVVEEPVQDGHQHRLSVTYRGGWPAGWIRRKIAIETDDADQGHIEVPVMATVTGTASR